MIDAQRIGGKLLGMDQFVRLKGLSDWPNKVCTPSIPNFHGYQLMLVIHARNISTWKPLPSKERGKMQIFITAPPSMTGTIC